jgi:hypothetical protein
MAKTKRRGCHTTQRIGKGKRQARRRRRTRRSGGIKFRNLGILDTFNRWYNSFRNRMWRKNTAHSEVKSNLTEPLIGKDSSKTSPLKLENSNKTFDAKDLKAYIDMFMDCYKKEFFLYRPIKRGKCKKLSDHFPSIFCMTQKLKTDLIDVIGARIGQLVDDEISKNPTKTFDKNKLSKKLLKQAIPSYQILTGYEPNVSEEDLNYFKETKDFGRSYILEPHKDVTTRSFQDILYGPWAKYPYVVSHPAEKYLTGEDMEILEKNAVDIITEQLKTKYKKSSLEELLLKSD